MASWYDPGRRTFRGVTYDSSDLTAAHRSLPFGTPVRVTNLENGRRVTVVVNDRGPFVRGRVIDVSKPAARRLGHRQVRPRPRKAGGAGAGADATLVVALLHGVRRGSGPASGVTGIGLTSQAGDAVRRLGQRRMAPSRGNRREAVERQGELEAARPGVGLAGVPVPPDALGQPDGDRAAGQQDRRDQQVRAEQVLGVEGVRLARLAGRPAPSAGTGAGRWRRSPPGSARCRGSARSAAPARRGHRRSAVLAEQTTARARRCRGSACARRTPPPGTSARTARGRAGRRRSRRCRWRTRGCPSRPRTACRGSRPRARPSRSAGRRPTAPGSAASRPSRRGRRRGPGRGAARVAS